MVKIIRQIKLKLRRLSLKPSQKLLLLLALLPLSAVLALAYSSQENKAGGDFQVELRENGFYPDKLVIKAGSSVTFVSKRGSFFWPASDLHPSHGVYPEFDPKAPIAPTKSWTFKFSKIGSWKYHDHLSPSFRGEIIVQLEDPQESTSSQNKLDCNQPDNAIPLTCRKEELLQILKTSGLDETFQRVEELYKLDRNVAAGCHGIAHDIGLASYPLYLKDKDSVLTPRSIYCASGFYHGFMEALLGATRNIELSRQFCLYVDTKLTSLAPDSYLQCFHGIGHGAIEYTLGAGLSPSSSEQVLITPALKLCEEAAKTDQELYRCASGAFNAIANFYIGSQYGLKPDLSDPLRLCKIQPEKYKESCFGNMNSYLISSTNQDLGEALKFVTGLDGGQAPKAVWYLAAIASAHNLLSFDLGKIKIALDDCRAIPSSLQKSCLEGLTQGFLEHGTPSLEYLDVIKFCSLSELTAPEKDVCFNFALGGLQGWYDKDKVIRICREIDPSLQKYCQSSLQSF
ncbi:MAG TPA: cupredoxin domain-containing protein [Patescibacteria group bacterium]|nr:cupredoxin domain-containing protein [Patescibacteria group bacterium]